MNGKDTLTLDEWQVAPKLLEKMIVRSGISHADYINDYKEETINFVIRELNKK